MDKSVINFLNSIKEFYWLYLYNTKFMDDRGKKRYADFPVCCRVSAVLISLFLQDCFSENDYKCYFSAYGLHGFTLCTLSKEVIDFTDLQFLIGDQNISKIKTHDLGSDVELLELIQEYEVIIPYCGGGYGLHNTAGEVDLKKYPFVRKKRSLNERDFEECLKENWELVNKHIMYNVY